MLPSLSTEPAELNWTASGVMPLVLLAAATAAGGALVTAPSMIA